MDLFEITPSGKSGLAGVDLARVSPEAAEATREMYALTGFVSPWVAYFAAEGGQPVGFCAFKSPPVAGRVEIAYHTFPAHEGRGMATRMARSLMELAWQKDPTLTVVAQTLPEEGASTAILRKLGFRLSGTVQHPTDGEVWEWVRSRS